MSSRLWIVTGIILVIVALGVAIYVSQRGPEASTLEPNQAPVASDDGEVLIQQNSPVQINVLANDTNLLTGAVVTVSQAPTNGTTTVGTNGVNIYTPNSDFTGKDTYTYQVCNGAQCDSATVSINVIEDDPLAPTTGSSSISGTSFYDVNENGLADTNEPGLADWMIYIDLNNNAILDEGEPNRETASNGGFTFANLAAGNYIVRETLKAGWIQTAPATSSYSRTIAANDSITGINFGNVNTEAVPDNNATE